VKERILTRLPFLEAHRHGKEVLLVHKENIGEMIKSASEYSLAGSSIVNKADDTLLQSQKVMSVSQIIVYNVSESKNAPSCTSHHLKTRETHLPVYLGLLIHAETRDPLLMNFML
jgi:hypothetical protein